MLDIYTARVSDLYKEEELYPPRRQEIINNTKSPEVRRERIAVWRLLEYAVKISLGKSMHEISPYLDENGKWLSEGCCFSLAHSNGAIAVAISDSQVGIDIERQRDVDIEAFSRRVLTPFERLRFDGENDKNRYIIELWTKKESIYKFNGSPPFVPSKLECKNYKTKTFSEKIDGINYFISVCSEKIDEIKLIKVTNE